MNRQKAKQFSSILLPIRIASAFLSFVIFFISIFPAGTVIAVPAVDVCAKSSFFKITNRDEVSSVFPVPSVREIYDAYGIMIGGSPNILNPSATNMLYSGEQFDPILQMQYLRARYYDQNIGRFNRLDPFGGNNYDPQSLHKYAYTHCNPVMGVDPSGEITILQVAVAMGVLSGLSTFTYLNICKGIDVGLASAYAVLAGILTTLGIFYAPIIIPAIMAASIPVQVGFATLTLFFLFMSAYTMWDAMEIAFSDEYSSKQKIAAVFFIISQISIWFVSINFVKGNFPMGKNASATPSGALKGGPVLIMSVPKGKKFVQAIGPLSEQPKPGSWATNTIYATEAMTRSKLAILSQFKKTITGFRTIKVESSSVSAEVGIVGPQKELPGGGLQFMFMDSTGRASSKGIIFTQEPLRRFQ